MRYAIALLLILAAADRAGAATIEGSGALACQDLAAHQRLRTILGAGDNAAAQAFIEQQLHARKCNLVPEGVKVRIEENSYPFACVAKVGSPAPCVWLRQRNVNPSEK